MRMMLSMMMMITHQGRNNMGVIKQAAIAVQEMLDGEEPTEEQVINYMVEEYMKSPQYYKEHRDQEKKIANDLTVLNSSAKI